MKLARQEMHALTIKSGIKKTFPNMGSIIVFTSLKRHVLVENFFVFSSKKSIIYKETNVSSLFT